MPLRAPKGFIDETDPKVCQIGHPAPAWLVNYADLMTELVCFFVILYALSAALNKDAQKAKQDVDKMNDKSVSAKIDKEGLKISLQETNQQAFFQSGSAEITPELKALIHKVGVVLRPMAGKQDIIVEGHTDNVPIHTDLYLNNWELSSARATNVVEAFVREEGFPADHMGAAGYGEHRPIAANDSPENRAKNRRVVFWVKNPAASSAPEPKAEKEGESKGAEGKTEVGSLSAAGATGVVESAAKGKAP